MKDLLDNITNGNAVFWLLVILGVLLLIEIAVFAVLIIRVRNRNAARQLMSLTLDTSIVKREYQIGEGFDYLGLIATANYSEEPFGETISEFTIATPELLKKLKDDGKEPEDYDGCLIYVPDLSIEGKPTVTVSYHGVSASYAVSVVVARQLMSLTLDTSIVKREYEIGEKFDYLGLIATANYSEEPFGETISEFAIATPELFKQLEDEGKRPEDYDGCLIYVPDLSVEGKPTVTVSYHGVSASYAVSVVIERVSPVERMVVATVPQPAPERRLVGISLNTDAVRKEYNAGEHLDLNGLVVYGNYNIEPFAQVVEGYSVLPVDMSVANPTVMVSYGGFVSSFSVNVKPVVKQPEVIRTAPEPVVIEEESVEAGVLRYDRSFTARFIQSDDELKKWYTDLKNYILSHKKVKDRMSWKRETYRIGREPVARLSYRGKTLCLYLPLNPNDYVDSKYKVEDASDNTSYADTPCMYRLKNERRVKYAMELVDVVMERLGTTKVEHESVDYYVPYEGVVELINKGLIKRNIKDRSDEAFFEEKQAEGNK